MIATDQSLVVVAHTLLQTILNVARLAAKTCPQGTVTTEGCKEKGKILLECAAELHLMRSKGWESVIDECVHQCGVEGGHVAGRL